MPTRWQWLAFLPCLACAQAADLPRSVRQGDTIRIHGPAAAVSARMADRKVRLFPDGGGQSFGLMPAPVDQKPGEYSLELLDAHGATVASYPIAVAGAHFKKQNVTISEGTAELKPSPGETETVTAFREAISDK